VATTRAETRRRKQAYYLRHKERIKAHVRDYRLAHPELCNARSRNYYRLHKKQASAKAKIRYRRNKAAILGKCRAYHQRNREKLLSYMKALYRKNRKPRIAKQRAYYRSHRKRILRNEKRKRAINPGPYRARAMKYRADNLSEVRKYDRIRCRKRAKTRAWKENHKRWRNRNPDRVRAYTRKPLLKARLLLGSRCITCGHGDQDVLEIDHTIAFMTLGIKRPTSSSAARDALKNPEQFQLLCANCHAIKSALEKRARQPHPTSAKLSYQKRRDALIKMFGSRCKHCGYDRNPLAFEFDHIKPILGKHRLPATIAVFKTPHRFQMLCANCHTKKTLMDMAKRRRTG